MSIYLENILDLFKHPLNFGVLKAADITHRSFNPLCGDDITVDLKIKAGKITAVKFRGNGCAISIASMSLVTENIKTMQLDAVEKLEASQVIELLGIDVGPVRLKCALIGLQAVKLAIMEYRSGSVKGEDIVEE